MTENIKNRIISSLIILLITITFPYCNNENGEKDIFLNNSKLMLSFDKKTGGLRVFRDLVNSHDFIDTNIILNSPWKVEILKPSYNDKTYNGFTGEKRHLASKEPKIIDISYATKFSYSKPDPYTLTLKWSNFKGSGNINIQITANISLDENKPLSYWKISLEDIEGINISRVAFPVFKGIKDSGDGEDCLAVPVWMGQLIKDPKTHLLMIKDKERKYEWDYPGSFSMQCFALYNSHKYGFYAACNDTMAYRKSFSLSLDIHKNLVYQMNNYPELDSSLNHYTPRYEAVIGSFKGDWITAAEQYRDWGTKQRWCLESRFKNGLTPKWLEKTALWVWNRGKSEDVLIPARELKQILNLPVNVFWHWWHGCSYDDGFPEYFPPREGKDSFIKSVSAAKTEDVRAIIYMNQGLWGTSTESWKDKNASKFAVKDINGRIDAKVYNIFSGKSLAHMCMGTQFWKDKYSSLCDSAINIYQTDGVYMDMACTNEMCYDPNHGHSVGGGNYWVDNFGKLTSQIRSNISYENQTVLTGEGGGEAWLPFLDAFLTLQVSRERYAGIDGWETREKNRGLDGWITIPFFQAVYHQYGITFGNYSSLVTPPYDELWPDKYAPKKSLIPLDTVFNKQFLMEQARSFVWGMQPTIANYQTSLASERKEEIEYLLNLSRVRYQGLQYLLYGKFMRSPYILFPEENIFISKLSIYTERIGENVTTYNRSFPLIYSGTWQSDNKQIGIALASISDEPFRIKFSCNSYDYKLSSSGDIYIIDSQKRRKLSEYSNNKILVDFMLPPRGLCIVELISNN